jgi:hypothetical protein
MARGSCRMRAAPATASDHRRHRGHHLEGSEKRGMPKPWTPGLFLGPLIGAMLAARPAGRHRRSSVRCDAFGACRGTVGGQPFASRGDAFRRVTGRIGRRCFDAQTDSYGNTAGTIDGHAFHTRIDAFGNTTGEIAGRRFSSHTDNFGHTRGEIGGRAFESRTDGFGETSWPRP